MPSYWWQCLNCNKFFNFQEVTNSKGISHFIWDELYLSDWDQNILIKNCPSCKNHQLKISYEFPRKDKIILYVNNIVGITKDNNFMQLLWATSPIEDLNDVWYDFKYLNGKSIFGLTKPVVFDKEELKNIMELFNRKCYKLF